MSSNMKHRPSPRRALAAAARVRRHMRSNVIGYVALFVALGGTSAYAANTVFSADIVDGEVRTQDINTEDVTNAKLAPNSVGTGKVIDNHLTGTDIAPNSLKGADIDESSLELDLQATAKVATRRTAIPVGTSGQVVLDVPGFGEVRQAVCSGKSAKSSFFNDTSKTIDVFKDDSRLTTGQTGYTTTTDPQFHTLAPSESAAARDIEGTERTVYQVGFGSNPGSVATIVVMGRSGDSTNCHWQAQAVIHGG